MINLAHKLVGFVGGVLVESFDDVLSDNPLDVDGSLREESNVGQ